MDVRWCQNRGKDERPPARPPAIIYPLGPLRNSSPPSDPPRLKTFRPACRCVMYCWVILEQMQTSLAVGFRASRDRGFGFLRTEFGDGICFAHRCTNVPTYYYSQIYCECNLSSHFNCGLIGLSPNVVQFDINCNL